MVIIRRNMIRFCANEVLFSRKLNTFLIYDHTFLKNKGKIIQKVAFYLCYATFWIIFPFFLEK